MRERPELPDHLTWYFDAFWLLSTDRHVAFGVGPIPYSAMDRFRLQHRLSAGEFDRLLALVRSMDEAYLEDAAKQAKRKG